MGNTPVYEFSLSISDSDDDAEELHDLHEALRDDYELTGVRTSMTYAPPPAGAMGAEEILRIVFDNPELYVAVSTCVTAWFATRKSRRLKIIIRANGSAEIQADGIREITSAEVADALRLAREQKPGATS